MSDADNSIADLLGAVGGSQSDAVRNLPEVARARIEQWFARQWPHRDDVRIAGLSTPAGGASNEMLVLDLQWRDGGARQAGRFVLRFEPGEDPVAPRLGGRYASSIELEYHVQQAVAAFSRCPVAPLVGLETSPDVLGRPFYVMGFVAGRVPPTQGPNLNSFLVDDLDAAQRRTLAESGLEALASVHRMDWRRTGLDGLCPDSGDVVAPQIRQYRALCEKHLRGADHPVLYEALDWLHDNAPSGVAPVLTWGDSRPGNMVFGSDGRVAAALDWELAAILPAAADVALWLVADYMVHEVEGAVRLAGYPTRAEQLCHYERHAGSAIEDLHYWEIFTAMKIAYVFVRVVRRMQDGGLMPANQDQLILDNFGVHYIRDNIGKADSTLLQDEERSA